MKKLLLVLFAAVLSFSSFSAPNQTSKLERFLYNEGVEVLASLAHPTNTYSSGSYRISNGYVYITANYSEGYTTKVKFRMRNDWFANVEVISDDDFFPPFLAIEGLKEIILELAEEDEDIEEDVDEFEQYLNKQLHNMTGKDLACLFMTLSWFDY